MVVIVVLSIVRQSEHLEGGRENVSEGNSSETGSKAVQEIDAWRTPQKLQKLGCALLTTKGTRNP